MKPLSIFLGWDRREVAAYHTFAQSIIQHTRWPVSIAPLKQDALRECGVYTRAVDEKAATEFSLTRFLVPFLSAYEGISIFADCDMIAKADLFWLYAKAASDPTKAVWVCQHDYVPKHAVKMDGQANAAYPRKNWSSLMVFNNAACKALTPEYVNSATPAELHRFAWVPDAQIGSLPLTWNWLVSEYPENPDAKILHYTEGGPWFAQYRGCDHASDWYDAYGPLALTEVAA